MRHPTERPFLYFLVAGALLLTGVLLLPVLHRSSATMRGLYLAVSVFLIVPFVFVPQLVFQIERRWIEQGSLTDAVRATRWTSVVLRSLAATALILLWLNFPWILSLWSEPPRPMTEEEAQSAVTTIRAWQRVEGGRLSALLTQLAWKWTPNPTVNVALSNTLRNECMAPQDPTNCFQGLHALFATGGQSPDLARVIVSLSERDPEVRANWKSTGWLLNRGEIAHYYRSMLLDMLGLLGPAAADVAEPELIVRLSDSEERSRWAAAGALDRVGSDAGRQQAAVFFARNVPALIDSYRVDRSRRLRACLFVLRAELKDPAVTGLALDALDDPHERVRSCGAFLLLTSGVPREEAEDRLIRAIETTEIPFARDSIAVALEILGTARARQTVSTYTAWEPERVQRLREHWNDRFFRLFGELL
jgi:hypothetical protein